MNNTFSARVALQFGWDTFKKRAWFLVGATLFLGVLFMCINTINQHAAGGFFIDALIGIFVMVVSVAIDMGQVSFFLRAHDDVGHVSLDSLWHPRSFWHYFVTVIMVGILTVAGLILLIVPGIVIMTMLAFVKLLIIDRHLGPIEAMKESARITHGHRLEILLLFLFLLAINVLGAIPLFLGLLLTVPVSMIAIAHAYRTLTNTSHIGSASVI